MTHYTSKVYNVKPIFTPRHYQQQIIDKQKDLRSFVIAKMGAGKTAATLMTIKDYIATTPDARVLVIAPLRVATSAWPDEINKWSNFASLSFAVCVGPVSQRKEALKSNAQITIVNRENVVWLVKYCGGELPFSFLVVDESTSFKSWASKRFKALKAQISGSTKVTLLTGTPAPNSYLELWSQVFLLDRGRALGRTITGYKRNYFIEERDGYTYSIADGAKDEINNAIKPYCVVVENYKGLPNIEYIEHNVQLSYDIMKKYKEFVRDKVLELGDVELTAVHAGALTCKIQQYAQGAVYDESKAWHVVHDEKIEALRCILEQAAGENVLVAYNYEHDRQRIKAAFKHAVDITERGAIEKWQWGDIKLLIAHPASAGHGLNLQSGGHRIVWFAPTWSNELKAQFDARLYRQGQTHTVFIHTIIAKDTIDEKVMRSLSDKSITQKSFIESVRGEL